MKKLLFIFSLICFCGCAHNSPAIIQTKWSNDMIAGFKYKMINSNEIRVYHFHEDFVAATIGHREWELWPIVRKVAVMAPILKWEISPEGQLLIKENNGDILYSYILKGRSKNRYFVIENGEDRILEMLK